MHSAWRKNDNETITSSTQGNAPHRWRRENDTAPHRSRIPVPFGCSDHAAHSLPRRSLWVCEDMTRACLPTWPVRLRHAPTWLVAHLVVTLWQFSLFHAPLLPPSLLSLAVCVCVPDSLSLYKHITAHVLSSPFLCHCMSLIKSQTEKPGRQREL